MSHKRRRTSKALRIALAGVVACSLLSAHGCRAIKNRRPDRKLVQARQLSLQGAELLSRDQSAAAEKLFTQAVEQCPTDERAHWGLSQTLWEAGQHQQAIQHLQEAVRLSGENPEYLVRLGEMYLQQGQTSQALAVADQLLGRLHNNAAAWKLKGDALANNRDWEAALQAYHRSLLVQPDDPKVQLAVAEIYRQMNRPHRALATLDRMVDHRPSMNIDGQMHLFRGLALADLNRNDEAIASFAAASRYLLPDDTPHQLQLAAAQHKIGLQDEAKRTLAVVLEKDPQNIDANRLASVFEMSYGHLATLPMESEDTSATTVIR